MVARVLVPEGRGVRSGLICGCWARCPVTSASLRMLTKCVRRKKLERLRLQPLSPQLAPPPRCGPEKASRRSDMTDRWLDPSDAARLIAVLPQLGAEGQALVERRCVAPWQRRLSRLAERDAAIRYLAIGASGTGRKITRTLHVELTRYAVTAWQLDRREPPLA